MWIRWKLEMLFRGFSKSNINQVLVDRLKHWVMDGRFHFQSWRINLYQFVAGATEVWATEPTALWNPVTPEMMRNDKLKFLEFLYFSRSRPGWCIWLPGLSCCIIASMLNFIRVPKLADHESLSALSRWYHLQGTLTGKDSLIMFAVWYRMNQRGRAVPCEGSSFQTKSTFA